VPAPIEAPVSTAVQPSTPTPARRGIERSSAVVPFDFEGSTVRVIDRIGEPWFVLADVCSVLEISNPSDAARRLDDDEKHTLDNVEGIASAQVRQITIVNESGLYSLILTSRKPEAKRFKKWVTSEVLPAIRRTGRCADRHSGYRARVSSGRNVTPAIPRSHSSRRIN
jgi:prophage antirepressor-like protein